MGERESRTSELELDLAANSTSWRGNGCWNGRKGQMSQKTKSREQRARTYDEDEKESESNSVLKTEIGKQSEGRQ